MEDDDPAAAQEAMKEEIMKGQEDTVPAMALNLKEDLKEEMAQFKEELQGELKTMLTDLLDSKKKRR